MSGTGEKSVVNLPTEREIITPKRKVPGGYSIWVERDKDGVTLYLMSEHNECGRIEELRTKVLFVDNYVMGKWERIRDELFLARAGAGIGMVLLCILALFGIRDLESYSTSQIFSMHLVPWLRLDWAIAAFGAWLVFIFLLKHARHFVSLLERSRKEHFVSYNFSETSKTQEKLSPYELADRICSLSDGWKGIKRSSHVLIKET